MTDSHYIGRFAPSPSGELHFGSLIAASAAIYQPTCAASNLARSHRISTPREVPGAAATILRQLEHYDTTGMAGLMAITQRHEAYREALARLHEQGLSYYCLPRSRIQRLGGIYDGHCRTLCHGPENAAVRINSSIR